MQAALADSAADVKGVTRARHARFAAAAVDDAHGIRAVATVAVAAGICACLATGAAELLDLPTGEHVVRVGATCACSAANGEHLLADARLSGLAASAVETAGAWAVTTHGFESDVSARLATGAAELHFSPVLI